MGCHELKRFAETADSAPGSHEICCTRRYEWIETSSIEQLEGCWIFHGFESSLISPWFDLPAAVVEMPQVSLASAVMIPAGCQLQHQYGASGTREGAAGWRSVNDAHMMRVCSIRKVILCALILISGWMIALLFIHETLVRNDRVVSTEAPLRPNSIVQDSQSNHRTKETHESFTEVHPTAQDGSIVDAICRGCRHAMADLNDTKSERCGVLIERERSYRAEFIHSSSEIDLSIAADSVAQRYPGCRHCAALRSNECDRRYWRFDDSAPRIHASHTQVETWFPHSLSPTQHTATNEANAHHYRRLPAEAFDNLTAYFSNPNHVYPKAEYFMEYNPSIVVLPPHVASIVQPDVASPNPLYLASFRVSNQHYCFRPMDRQLMQGLYTLGFKLQKPKGQSTLPPRDYLGLVILNATNWSIVADTIVDVNRADTSTATKGQDYRLFVLHQQVYLSSNDWITPLWLQQRVSGVDPPGRDAVTVPTVFGTSPFQVRIGRSIACAPCHQKTNRGTCGKNFNYFMPPTLDSTNTTVYVEIWPTGPHMVRTVPLNLPCQRQEKPTTYIDDTPRAPSSFATTEEIDFPTLGRRESIWTRGRGGACCIPLRRDNRTLLVGIQHVKTPSQGNRKLPVNVTSNHYVSSLYAFEGTLPFRIVAQSGWFCLGFPQSGHEPVPLLARATQWRRLALTNQRTLQCPRIHFVSGLTLKANDPSMVVLAYGINDCHSRFVEVRLSDLEALLFQGPEPPTT